MEAGAAVAVVVTAATKEMYQAVTKEIYQEEAEKENTADNGNAKA